MPYAFVLSPQFYNGCAPGQHVKSCVVGFRRRRRHCRHGARDYRGALSRGLCVHHRPDRMCHLHRLHHLQRVRLLALVNDSSCSP